MIKRVRMFLGIILMVVAMTACGNPDSNENATVVPDDFSFSLSWDTNDLTEWSKADFHASTYAPLDFVYASIWDHTSACSRGV